MRAAHAVICSREYNASQAQMRDAGWVCFERVLGPEQITSLRRALEQAVECCQAYQHQGNRREMTGTAHHVLALEDPKVTAPFWDFLASLPVSPVYDDMRRYFASPFILNSFGGVINLPYSEETEAPEKAYVAAVHRDVRVFTRDFPLMLNMLVMLDDFTPDNGATWVLSGSHHSGKKPDDELFFDEAEQLCAPAGSIVLFNSNLWHAAGQNVTVRPRRALTLTLSKPLMKPQFDYASCLRTLENASDDLKQLLGYYSRVPKTLADWYQPQSERFYQPCQDNDLSNDE